jgi:hypothetical protein
MELVSITNHPTGGLGSHVVEKHSLVIFVMMRLISTNKKWLGI